MSKHYSIYYSDVIGNFSKAYAFKQRQFIRQGATGIFVTLLEHWIGIVALIFAFSLRHHLLTALIILILGLVGDIWAYLHDLRLAANRVCQDILSYHPEYYDQPREVILEKVWNWKKKT